MPTFNGTLNQNLITNVLFNMIISQQVYSDNIKSSGALVDKAKVDGTLYGDTKLYIATDVLKSYPWLNDAEAPNLLQVDRPANPDTQAITISIYRQIAVTIDNYLSKQAFMNEGTFAQFQGAILGWLGDTKRVYDKTTYNVFIGTNETSVGEQNRTIALPALTGTPGADENAIYQLRALAISKEIEDLADELADPSRSFNDFENLREVSKEDLTIVMNNHYANEFRKIDIPGIFHNEGIVPSADKLQYRYFGTVNTTGSNAPTPNTNVRSMVEVDFNAVPMNDPTYDKKKHIFPGDLWPAGVAYAANDTFTVDDKIICKIIGGPLPPYMSAFVVETAFFNARALNENHYLTFGHNPIEHLKNYPFITIREQ